MVVVVVMMAMEVMAMVVMTMMMMEEEEKKRQLLFPLKLLYRSDPHHFSCDNGKKICYGQYETLNSIDKVQSP